MRSPPGLGAPPLVVPGLARAAHASPGGLVVTRSAPRRRLRADGTRKRGGRLRVLGRRRRPAAGDGTRSYGRDQLLHARVGHRCMAEDDSVPLKLFPAAALSGFAQSRGQPMAAPARAVKHGAACRSTAADVTGGTTAAAITRCTAGFVCTPSDDDVGVCQPAVCSISNGGSPIVHMESEFHMDYRALTAAGVMRGAQPKTAHFPYENEDGEGDAYMRIECGSADVSPSSIAYNGTSAMNYDSPGGFAGAPGLVARGAGAFYAGGPSLSLCGGVDGAVAGGTCWARLSSLAPSWTDGCARNLGEGGWGGASYTALGLHASANLMNLIEFN